MLANRGQCCFSTATGLWSFVLRLSPESPGCIYLASAGSPCWSGRPGHGEALASEERRATGVNPGLTVCNSWDLGKTFHLLNPQLSNL